MDFCVAIQIGDGSSEKILVVFKMLIVGRCLQFKSLLNFLIIHFFQILLRCS